tara:strand:- start:75 stop:4088 length:4014 start_codon:yes stop_codon:yes gene_type:complete
MTDIAINPVTRRVQFQGTTGTGPFAFSFNILQASDIAVLKNNVVLAIGTGATNYSVSINANGTGSVSLVTALISSDTLIIMGGRELSRTTDFVTAGDLLASSLNEQLDSNVVMSQQLDEKVDRSIIAQPGDKLVGINLSLPLVADRANELIKFDASGNVTTIPVTEIVGTDIDTQKVTIKTSAGATKLVINGNITDLITAADNLTIVSTSGDIDFKPGGGQINLLASTGAQRMALDNAAQATMQYFQNSNVTKLGVVDPTATRTLLLPNASDTLVGKATTDTLTNKTLASPVITGSLGVGTLTGSGDILLDAAGDIVLDAAGDQVFFKDGGTLRITFEIGASGTSMVSASELVMAVTSGGINFKPQTGNVDFLTNSGGQALQINAIGSSTITYYQNSNTTKLGVVNPTGSRVLLLPNASDTLVGKATTDTLTNKTLANPAFTGNLNFTGDVAIDASGDITLDADGGEIYFKDGGATRLTFQVSAVAATLNSASDFNVNSAGDIALKPAGGQVDILGTSGQQRIQFDNSAQATMKYYQNSNTTSLGVVDPTGTRTLLLPDASDTLVGKATTDTLTNKTLTSPTITGSLNMSDVNITNVGSIALDRITNDGSGGITLDSSQGINYDAGTGQNLFKVNGQIRLTVALNSSAIQTITSLATLSITAGNDINLRPNGGQLYVLNNAGGDNFQFNTSSTPTLGIHQNSNVTNLGLVSPTATRNILFPDASDTLVGKATTDTLTNKTLTSPVINTGVSGSAFLDEDNFASNSATKIASQQSIKAYVDAATAGGGAGSLSTVLGIGNTTGSNNVLFGDNNKAIFGAGSDLQIYHDGTHSYISDQGAGNLKILGAADVRIVKSDDSELSAKFVMDGAVELYHNNVKMFETTSAGATVTGSNFSIDATSGGRYFDFIVDSQNSYLDVSHNLIIRTNGASSLGEKMRITDAGRVGIGTSAPDAPLHTEGASGTQLVVEATSGNFAQMDFKIGGTQKGAIWVNEATDLMGYYTPSGWGKNFYTNGTESMRITSSGLVNIGESVESGSAGVDAKKLNVVGGLSTVYDASNTATWTGIQTGNSTNSSNRTATGLTFFHRTSSSGIAAIQSTSLSGDRADLRFITRGSDGITQRMMINDDGNVGIGSNAVASAKLYMAQSSASVVTAYLNNGVSSANSSTQPIIQCQFTGDNNVGTGTPFIKFASQSVFIGSITGAGSATSYNTSSDYRLKENVNYTWDATTRLKQLKPARFNWIADDTNTTIDGFLAHEAQAVVPECVIGTKDAMRDEEYEVTAAVEEVTDEDGNVTTEAADAVMGTRSVPDMQGIDQSKLVPLLVKTIQELEARITALEG